MQALKDALVRGSARVLNGPYPPGPKGRQSAPSKIKADDSGYLPDAPHCEQRVGKRYGEQEAPWPSRGVGQVHGEQKLASRPKVKGEQGRNLAPRLSWLHA